MNYRSLSFVSPELIPSTIHQLGVTPAARFGVPCERCEQLNVGEGH